MRAAPCLRDAYAVRVWVEAPYDLRLARGVARDGEAARVTWDDVWMPSEDRYVERDDPVAARIVVVDGSAAPERRHGRLASGPRQPARRSSALERSRPGRAASGRPSSSTTGMTSRTDDDVNASSRRASRASG